MKILQINASYGLGSTGKIMSDLDKVIKTKGHDGYMLFAYTNSPVDRNMFLTNATGSLFEVKKNIAISRFTGTMGYRYVVETRKIAKWIKHIAPDIIHLHNIHGDWINVSILFKTIKELNVPVLWTLHDCWAFTGRCSHFELCGCEKWKNQCYSCTNKKVYPITYFFDFSRKMYTDKKSWFMGLNRAVVVTPSNWLAKYVKDSFLGKYEIRTIHNGIDTEVFCPQNSRSKYLIGVEHKFIVLGVASTWSSRKGFDDLLKIDSCLDHKKFQVVMVGLNNKQLKSIPETIIGIQRTNNQNELAELYSNADVFVNPTYEEVLGMVNIEAMACGTPTLTYDSGGSPECVSDRSYVVQKGDYKSMANLIIEICEKNRIDSVALRKHVLEKFDIKKCYESYISLYEELI